MISTTVSSCDITPPMLFDLKHGEEEINPARSAHRGKARDRSKTSSS